MGKRAALASKIIDFTLQTLNPVTWFSPELRYTYKPFPYSDLIRTLNMGSSKDRARLNQSLHRWRRGGHITFKGQKLGPETEIRITKSGWAWFKKRHIMDIKPKKLERWDGLVRVVIFDIPEKLSYKRNVFREKLKEWDFVQVQRSVWVWPYPCLEEMRLLVEYYELEKYVSLFEGKYLGNDKILKKKFNLANV